MPRNDPEERERYRYMDEIADDREVRLRRAYESAGMEPDHPYGYGGRDARPDARDEREAVGRGEYQGAYRERHRQHQQPQPPQDPGHRGRGPRGYKRSDARIEEDVNDRLTEDPHVDATEIQVSVAGGEVTLAGIVDSRAARRRAEDVAESVSGVTYVMNNLRVRQPGGAGVVG
jgi:hypothetical protein